VHVWDEHRHPRGTGGRFAHVAAAGSVAVSRLPALAGAALAGAGQPRRPGPADGPPDDPALPLVRHHMQHYPQVHHRVTKGMQRLTLKYDDAVYEHWKQGYERDRWPQRREQARQNAYNRRLQQLMRREADDFALRPDPAGDFSAGYVRDRGGHHLEPLDVVAVHTPQSGHRGFGYIEDFDLQAGTATVRLDEGDGGHTVTVPGALVQRIDNQWKARSEAARDPVPESARWLTENLHRWVHDPLPLPVNLGQVRALLLRTARRLELPEPRGVWGSGS
jgi:hypothetical protein